MILVKRRRAIFRRGPIAVIVVQLENGSWHVDKMRGGRPLASKTLHNLSRGHLQLVLGESS